MKKITIILLMLVYGLSSTGATVHLHYCCGKLDDISFSQKTKKGCTTSKTAVCKKNCCDNRHIELKLKADQEPAAKWVQSFKLLQAPAILAVSDVTFINRQQPVNEYPTGPPLLSPSVPIFIKHCVFRI
jgi:hypothetical protein